MRRAVELDGLPPEQAAELGLGADALRDPEQLQRALRQLRVAAAAERLVGGHRAPREEHDGLEDHGHLAVAQELAQLARALREAVGQAGRLTAVVGSLVRRGGRAGGSSTSRAAEAELEVGEVQDVPLAERRVLDQGPVQEGAVLAAEVPQAQAGAEGVDLRVGLGDGVGGEDQLEPVAAADAEGQRRGSGPGGAGRRRRRSRGTSRASPIGRAVAAALPSSLTRVPPPSPYQYRPMAQG